MEALDANENVVYDSLVDLDGRVCIPLYDDDEYRIYRLRVRRRSEVHPILQVHFKGGPQARILGVVRIER